MKQEEIREGAIVSLMDYKGFDRVPTEYIIDHVLAYLHSQGVVIKTDYELPECGISKVLTGNSTAYNCPYFRKGYTAVEPLI